MTEEEIRRKINPAFPNVYAVTTYPTELLLHDGSTKVGYFQPIDDSTELARKSIFTFVEFGENAQRYRATGDKKYVSLISGDQIFDVVYPAKSPVLANRINQLKIKLGKQDEQFWIDYKEGWKDSISNLVGQIVYKWLKVEEEAGLLKTEIIHVSKTEPYFGKYINTRLEIIFAAGGFIVFDPIAAITSEYDGRADLFSLTESSKRVAFLRQYTDGQKVNWVIAATANRHEDIPLNESSFKSILTKWGYLS